VLPTRTPAVAIHGTHTRGPCRTARKGLVVSGTRWRLAALAPALAGVLLLAGCGDGNDGPRWDARAVSASQAAAGVTPVLVNSNVGVGETRLAFGFFRTDQSLLAEAAVTAHLFRLGDDPEAQPSAGEAAGELALKPVALVQGVDHLHADGVVHAHTGLVATIYVATATLDTPGWWGAALDVRGGDVAVEGMRLTFFVQDHTSEPAVGDPAPATRQRTLADAPIEDLDSTLPPNPGLHERTIADALAERRPLVVAFATPAFCQTQFCGPVMESVVIPAWERYRERVDFIHIEPWDLPKAREGSLAPVDAVREWGLLSEPFVFVIDGDGKIAAKFEGIVGADELDAAIEQVLSAGGAR